MLFKRDLLCLSSTFIPLQAAWKNDFKILLKRWLCHLLIILNVCNKEFMI